MHVRSAACVVMGMLTLGVAGQAAPALHTIPMRTLNDTRAFFHYTGEGLPIISAHRGGSDPGFPENTILAFEHVLQSTPAMFETDPHLTADGKLIVMHDDTLDRTTADHGPVKERTLSELQRLTMKDSAGAPVNTHPPSLDELIAWAAGKTVLNLDIKDAPAEARLDAVRQHNAFATVLFTVHNAEQAKFFYGADHRSLLACVIFSVAQMQTYEDAGIPWQNIAIAYVGSKSSPENRPLYDALHAKGMKVMVATAPTYDKLPSEEERAAAYRRVIAEGADILESDRPIEVARAIQGMRIHAARPLHTSRSARGTIWPQQRSPRTFWPSTLVALTSSFAGCPAPSWSRWRPVRKRHRACL